MRPTKFMITALVAGIPLLCSAQSDNSKSNKRDKSDSSVTAQRQGNNKADVDLTARIRQEIMNDDSLSTYAKNLKIVVKEGTVTLRGPVRSESERRSIEAIAKKAAPDHKVTNQIEIAPDKD